MMQAIITTLSQKGILTIGESKSLNEQKTQQDFLTTLTKIYEDKVRSYLSVCERSVRRVLLGQDPYKNQTKEELDLSVHQWIVNYAYSAIFDLDPSFLFVPLMYFLKENEPDLAVSLGMSGIYRDKSQSSPVTYVLKNQLLQVFIRYVARYQIYRHVGNHLGEFYPAAKQASEASAKEEKPKTEERESYPRYLFDSFIIQSVIKTSVEKRIADSSEKKAPISWPTALAQEAKAHPEYFYESLKRLVFYVGTVLDDSNINKDHRPLLFSHLQSKESQWKFADAIAHGYLEQLVSEERQQQVLKANKAVYEENAIQRICAPALSFFGLTLGVGEEAWKKKQDELEKEVAAIEQNKAAIDSAAEKNRLALAKELQNKKLELGQALEQHQQETNRRADAIRNNVGGWMIGFGTNF